MVDFTILVLFGMYAVNIIALLKVWKYMSIHGRNTELRDKWVYDCFTATAKDLTGILQTLHIMSHDFQQIKTRLTWSRKREKKDLKHEGVKSKK
jgi:hypothetical protein